MPWVMAITGSQEEAGQHFGLLVAQIASGVPQWLREFDPDGNDGNGHVALTTDLRKAKRFPTPIAVVNTWTQPSTVRPLTRGPDGKWCAYRPLKAFKIEPQRVAE